MRNLLILGILAALAASQPAAAGAAGPAPLSAAFNSQLSMTEKEVVSLAEAMPEDKYGFAPTEGSFQKVRTFGQQAAHIAAVIYACSGSVLGEKPPMGMGTGENGPAEIKSKAQIVKFLKDAFAYGHRAMASLTAANLNDQIPSAFGGEKVSRVSMATVPVWHSFDHYGQMVVYARMNGIVPPASR